MYTQEHLALRAAHKEIKHRVETLKELAYIYYEFNKDNSFLSHSLNRLISPTWNWHKVYMKFIILDMLYMYIADYSNYSGLQILRIEAVFRHYAILSLDQWRTNRMLGPAKSVSFTTCSCVKCKTNMQIEYPEQLTNEYYSQIICEECLVKE